MDSNKVYRKPKGKVYRRDRDKIQPVIHYNQYRDGDKQPHHANLHFVQNGNIVETIEEDVTFAWANTQKNELKRQIPYCDGVLVVVSIYASDQIQGGNKNSSRTVPRK